jgi:hypothetical protein
MKHQIVPELQLITAELRIAVQVLRVMRAQLEVIRALQKMTPTDQAPLQIGGSVTL